MRHVYKCPMRWSDLDFMQHVNNVVYVDYLQEARVDMLRVHSELSDPDRSGEDLTDGLVVVNHAIDYLRPLLLTSEPVHIESWVSSIRRASFTVAYELSQPAHGGQISARATTTLTPFVFGTGRPRRIGEGERAGYSRFLEDTPLPDPLARRKPAPGEGWHHRISVRFSDVDVYAHVNNVHYLEYLQEARVAIIGEVWAGASTLPHLVVRRTEVDYVRPLLLRGDPYDVRSWISRVGGSSFVLESEILDGETLYAKSRVLIVHLDPLSGAPAPLSQEVRGRLVSPGS